MVDDKDRGFETQEERRSHDRSRLIVDVFFDGKDVTGVASTKDISPGGLYLNTQAELRKAFEEFQAGTFLKHK